LLRIHAWSGSNFMLEIDKLMQWPATHRSQLAEEILCGKTEIKG